MISVHQQQFTDYFGYILWKPVRQGSVMSSPPLTGLPNHALPVLNHNQTDHNTKLMDPWCIATVAWSSYYCLISLNWRHQLVYTVRLLETWASWSWTVNKLKESKSNMLQEHIWSAHCSRSMFVIYSWSSVLFKYGPGAYSTYKILQDY